MPRAMGTAAFRELLDDEGLEPRPGVKAVLADWSPMSTHAVDVTDTFDRGLESYRAHQVYLDGLGPDAPDPQEFMEGLSRMARDSERGSPSPSSRCRCSCSSDCCSQHPVSPRRLR